MVNLININGKNYSPRFQVFPFRVTVSTNGQVLLNQRLNLPGVAPFRLLQLTRQTIVDGTVQPRLFKYRFGNTDGGIYYQNAGLAGTTDRVLDVLMFGDGRFPYTLNTAIYYEPNASITMEIEDVSLDTPYDIEFAYHGQYLLPA